MIKQENIIAFKKFIWKLYTEHKRAFPWRHNANPYEVVISEVMLQQTQTYRVEPKYLAFIAALPNIKALAEADLRTVLTLWQGLGYNRRGKFLHIMAQQIQQNYNGIIPDTPELLAQLPGIGKATAGSICAFAFNKPTIFIETNIRAVFIHYFFSGRNDVHDKEIEPLVAMTVDHENPREWYYALMDYGVYLKKKLPNPSRNSKHHIIQSKFEGSDRQIRGAIIRELTKLQAIESGTLFNVIGGDRARIEYIVQQLINEQFIKKINNVFSIKS
jgi:A/G-specific adenine glycosylase